MSHSDGIPDWVGGYVGIPFVDCGRERVPGVDCYGLARLVQIERFGIELPRFDGYRSTVREARELTERIERHKRRFAVKIAPDDARPGDCVLMRQSGNLHIAVHAGTDGGRCMVLHTTSDHGHSHLERMDGDELRNADPTWHRIA